MMYVYRADGFVVYAQSRQLCCMCTEQTVNVVSAHNRQLIFMCRELTVSVVCAQSRHLML